MLNTRSENRKNNVENNKIGNFSELFNTNGNVSYKEVIFTEREKVLR